mmetsp:Transcript_1974/g.4487  ORF Transcript_1974/g.4487 Transcript_1974/m.4487 type:complete len:400 (-) Transcript_1974:785-1984(-)
MSIFKLTKMAATKPQGAVSALVAKKGEPLGQVFTHPSEPVLGAVTQDGQKVYIFALSLQTKARGNECTNDSKIVATFEAGGTVGEIFTIAFSEGHSSGCIIGTRSKDGSTSFHAVLVDLEGANETIKLKGSAGSKDTKKRKQPESKSRGVTEAKAGAKESNASASAEEGVPLDQRIAKLDLQQNKQQDANNNNKEGSKQEGRISSFRADSLAVLLSQAVQSNDRQLLEECLQVKSEAVVANTVKALRSDQVGKLMPLLVDRINASSSRAAQVANWIRHIVKHHLAYILSAPSMKQSLSVLYQSLSERQSSYTPLLGLSGRLDLLSSHIRAMRNKQSRDVGSVGSGDSVYDDPAVVHIHPSDREDAEDFNLVDSDSDESGGEDDDDMSESSDDELDVMED